MKLNLMTCWVVLSLSLSSLAWSAPKTCDPGVISKLENAMARVSNDYAARALSCSEAKALEVALHYSQAGGCGAIEFTVTMVNDVLDQRNERPGYFAQIVRPCP